MLNYLVEFKWQVLITFEIVSWLFTFCMIYARYWLHSNIQFYIFGVLSILTGYVPDVVIGILNFVKYQKIDVFTVVIILIIVFTLMFEKKIVLKTDIVIRAWIEKHRKQVKQVSTSNNFAKREV